MEIKRKLYIFLFTVLGLVFGFFVAELVQLVYLRLLLADFARYSFGLSWSDLGQFYYFFSVLVVAFTGFWGYAAGKFWWRQIYVLKKYDKKRWNNFIRQ